MKIVILGKGKSGTTALAHMIAAAFPECRAVTGGFRAHMRERTAPKADSNANFVAKFTYNEKKGRSFDTVMRHIDDEGYQKKIWVTRDPRDNAVSDALFRWRRRHRKSARQFRACLPLVQAKERDPGSVPFSEIFRFTGDRGGPETLEQMIGNETFRYRRMTEFVNSLGPDWFIFKYEDLVERRFDALASYLGREVALTAELPLKDQVKARTKSYGDWRNWFTEADVEIFAPLYTPYMEMVGYDASDWALPAEPEIDPRTGSEYMQRISSEGRSRGFDGVKAGIGRLYDSATALVGRASS